MHEGYLLPTLNLDSELRYQSTSSYNLGLSIAELLNIFFSKLAWVVLQWFNNILWTPTQQESLQWLNLYSCCLRDEEIP